MKWSHRNCLNKTLYVAFKFFTLCYTGWYYYFMPWVSSFLVFFLLIDQNKKSALV